MAKKTSRKSPTGGPSTVHAARLKIADLLNLPLGAIRIVQPGERPQRALGSMELEELRAKWRKWPHP